MTTTTTFPWLTPYDIEEFSKGHQILINPTINEIKASIAKIERRCKKNLLDTTRALEAYHQVKIGGAESAHAGLRNCPRYFQFAVTSTVIQVARLADDLIACSIGRRQAYPGEQGLPSITTNIYDDPLLWAQQVITTYWTALGDDQLNAIQERAVLVAMRIAAETAWLNHHDAGANRARAKRELQLQALFRSSKPVYTSELRFWLGQISRMLREQGVSKIDWRTFKQEWPSIATRYKRDLLSIFKCGAAATEALPKFRSDFERYSVNFTTWDGAQTIFPGTQIVFQICSKQLSLSEGSEYLFSYALRQSLYELALRSCHPVTTTTVGWLRVHVDDHHRVCFIDEIQSDLIEFLRCDDLVQDMAARMVINELSDWLTHGVSTVQHWAHSIGYRLAIHSKESAQTIRDKTESERKWNVYYNSVIKRLKLQRTELTEYPAPVFIEA